MRGDDTVAGPPSVQSRLAAVPRRRRWRAVLHRLRALRHHTVAVLREFRVPIICFLAVTVVGGFLYGELYRLARGEVLPLIDRPYVMVQLMLLEAPEPVPPEWYLVGFWYGLPVVFVILVALGAADFVDLFFNRNDERDAWGEALAMSYRNHVIVLGAGHVGLRAVRDLVDMGSEVVVVDSAPGDEVRAVLDRLGVPLVLGDGRQGATLERAGVREAEAFVACTADDSVNLQAVVKVRHENPDARIVVRMWDRTAAVEGVIGAHAVLSAADLAAPAFAGAAVGVEITQTLEIGGAEYSTLRLRVEPGSFLDGHSVGGLEEENDMEIVLRCRGEDVEVDPPADRRVAAGEDLVIFAGHQRILEVVARNRRPG